MPKKTPDSLPSPTAEQPISTTELPELVPNTVFEDAYVREDELQRHPEVVSIMQGESIISTDKKIASYAFSRCRALLVINKDNGATFFQHLGPTHTEAFIGNHRARGAQLSKLFTLFTDEAKRHDSRLTVLTIAGDATGWGKEVGNEIDKLLTEAGIAHTNLPEIKVPSGEIYDWSLNYDPKNGKIVICYVVNEGDTKETVHQEYAVPGVSFPEYSNSRADIDADLDEVRKISRLVGDVDDLFKYGITSRMGPPRSIAKLLDVFRTLLEEVRGREDTIIYPYSEFIKDAKVWYDWWSNRILDPYTDKYPDRIRQAMTLEDAKAILQMLTGLKYCIDESEGTESIEHIPEEIKWKIHKIRNSINAQSLYALLQAWHELFTMDEHFALYAPEADITWEKNRAEAEATEWAKNPIKTN